MTRIFRFDPRARLEVLERAAKELGEKPEVLAVVLFGSLAQGRATAMSDADLLVLLESSTLSFSERLSHYRPKGVPGVEVFPYTLDEAQRSLQEGWGVLRPALSSGYLMFERQGVWASLKKAHQLGKA
jgi:hypothetical protein